MKHPLKKTVAMLSKLFQAHRDALLFDAVERGDYAQGEKALRAGANPNAVRAQLDVFPEIGPVPSTRSESVLAVALKYQPDRLGTSPLVEALTAAGARLLPQETAAVRVEPSLLPTPRRPIGPR